MGATRSSETLIAIYKRSNVGKRKKKKRKEKERKNERKQSEVILVTGHGGL
jgi:hypothetical protein